MRQIQNRSTLLVTIDPLILSGLVQRFPKKLLTVWFTSRLRSWRAAPPLLLEKMQLLPLPNCQRTIAPAAYAFRLAHRVLAHLGSPSLSRIATGQEAVHSGQMQRLAPSSFMEMTGIEPVTSWLQTTRSPS
jgi:hypothetical protein